MFVFMWRVQAAAQEGIPPAIFNLGNLYAAGVGVAQSDESALACYEGAAGSVQQTVRAVDSGVHARLLSNSCLLQ